MAEPPLDTRHDNSIRPDDESTTVTPRWVKVFGILALVVVLLVIVVLVVGGNHGPRRHSDGGRTLPLWPLQ